MKCIIPAAGKGTRLLPHTQNKPKALLQLANKPIISHIVDKILEANITDIIIIVGYEKEKLMKFLLSQYSDKCNLTFIEQEERRGLGHAIYMASKHLNGESTIITLGDSLYELSYLSMLEEFRKNKTWDGVITIRQVSNPQSYGIVVTDPNSSIIIKMIEKPQTPISNKAITGVYMIRNTIALQKSLNSIVETNSTGAGGEIQLTDALQIMIENGFTLGIIDSGTWFDCGNKESLLEANRFVLSSLQNSERKSELKDSVIVHPVAIEAGCSIRNSIIGPNVSIAKDTTVTRVIISSSIIGSNSVLDNVNISDSIIGNNVWVKDKTHDVNIGDNEKVQFS
ncbi:MAG: sugar phosphate nucleotidyltransferase [Candidatus Hodarchaeales archaeon]